MGGCASGGLGLLSRTSFDETIPVLSGYDLWCAAIPDTVMRWWLGTSLRYVVGRMYRLSLQRFVPVSCRVVCVCCIVFLWSASGWRSAMREAGFRLGLIGRAHASLETHIEVGNRIDNWNSHG